ncbi:MAG: adenosine deaminase, partial [Candidatus Berkiella sp.]
NTLKDHNLKQLLDLGLCITINSDDAAYFGGYVVDNFLAAQRELNLKAQDIVTLAQNSIKASFLTDEQKAKYMREISMIVQNHLRD